MSFERYRTTAMRVVEENGIVGHHGMGDLVLGIQQALHAFVEHDLEWAALAVEQAIREAETADDLVHRLVEAVDAMRQRGRE
jgi:hypothetical protein